MKKILLRYVTVMTLFIFVFQIGAISALNAQDTGKIKKAYGYVRGKLSSFRDVVTNLGKDAFAKLVKSSFSRDTAKIRQSLLNQVKKEGMSKVIQDMDQLGPLGKNLAARLKKLNTEEEQFALLDGMLNKNLELLQNEIGKKTEAEIAEELQLSEKRFELSEKMEAIQEHNLDFQLSESNRKSIVTFKKLDFDAQAMGDILEKGLKAVGIAGALVVLVSVGIFASGHVAIGSVILIIGGAIALYPVYFIGRLLYEIFKGL